MKVLFIFNKIPVFMIKNDEFHSIEHDYYGIHGQND